MLVGSCGELDAKSPAFTFYLAHKEHAVTFGHSFEALLGLPQREALLNT